MLRRPSDASRGSAASTPIFAPTLPGIAGSTAIRPDLPVSMPKPKLIGVTV